MLLQIYHRLPPPLRNLAASIRGARLRSIRYGEETERLVAEARERERWSPPQWERWQGDRLAHVLHRAATSVPYYRQLWAERRRRGDSSSWDQLENWPILEKEALRQNPRAFVADDCNVRKMVHDHTSGTTGASLSLYLQRSTVRQWYALFERRCRVWNGVNRHDRWAILGGQLITPVHQRHPPFWVWNSGLNQLYLSSYHLAPDLISHYLEALRRYRITYLLGYTSALYELALTILEKGVHDLRMKVVLTNAEPVYDYQRSAIAKAFGCPVRESYGMAEIVAAASECSAGNLHYWPEAGLLEILEHGSPVADGASGDFICTGLLNDDMPLIRYRVGDRGAKVPSGEECPCGCRLPRLAGIEGRADDVLYTADGRAVGRLDPVFKADLPVREAQIIQESLSAVRVRYIPTANFTAAAGRSIVERLQQRLGPVEVLLEPVSELPRTRNGKFRAVLCNLSPAEKSKLRSRQALEPVVG